MQAMSSYRASSGYLTTAGLGFVPHISNHDKGISGNRCRHLFIPDDIHVLDYELETPGIGSGTTVIPQGYDTRLPAPAFHARSATVGTCPASQPLGSWGR